MLPNNFPHNQERYVRSCVSVYILVSDISNEAVDVDVAIAGVDVAGADGDKAGADVDNIDGAGAGFTPGMSENPVVAPPTKSCQ